MGEGDSIRLPDQPEQRRNPNRRALAPAASKIALELFIVFVGVSAAFAVEDYRDAREDDGRREAVYRALDRELRQMAVTHGPLYQRRMSEELGAWDQALARGEKPLPPTFRTYGAERAPTGVWDAAVASGSIELVEPDLFFELARYYNRMNSVGDIAQRYSTEAQVEIWPYVNEGPSAFWDANGELRPATRAHVARLREFRDRQRFLPPQAKALREKLQRAAEN